MNWTCRPVLARFRCAGVGWGFDGLHRAIVAAVLNRLIIKIP